ncbi:MAG TPA: DNA polymerase III subunit alpha [Pyrinomonadaceae bacterium]|nr:DNA polymerase III subunit alpha [Pyrinomonadaceae bacterium]
MGTIQFKTRDFVHLHLHTDYSLLQSTIQLRPLVQKLNKIELQACAITDSGNMYGAVSFYSEMASEGIRPIIGYEAFVASTSLSEYGNAVRAGERPYYDLVLLAFDLEGYQNLVRLSSKAFTEGFRYKPLIDLELLSAHSSGLIGLSGGKEGAISHHLLNNDPEKAIETARQLETIFGKGNFFLELIDHGLPEQSELISSLSELSIKTQIPLVATNAARYLTEQDARAHEVMLCIGEGRTVRNGGEPSSGTTKAYVRSAEEMWDIFGSEYPEALMNTLEIAERCKVELSVSANDLVLPNFPIPEESDADDLAAYFELQVAQGFENRKQTMLLPLKRDGRLRYDLDVYQERLNSEVKVIKRMGYEGYFLIVWDFIKYAVERGIPVGPGRGSAAGSLVAYCLGITGIDPIQYDLLFERFLNPERVSMPDIDIDFCIRGRAEVINHVTELYGRESVCQIITFGTMASKAAIKDVGRALNMPYGEVERIAKLIPPPIRGRNVSISRALETVGELKSLVEKDPAVKDLVDLALRLEGCSRHSSVHAAGVVIAPKPLYEIVPVAISARGELTSQYSMNDLEKVGMLKMDFLALTTLTVIDDCLKSLRERDGVEIDWNSVSLQDEKTMAVFSEGRTDAVFQFESSGMQEICRRLKPKEFEDLSALNALYRPGPLDGGMIEDFIQRHRGEKKVKYLLPEMEEILKNTFGVLVYQEQIMQIAQKLAGYSLGEADVMRRAMGKKKREAMAKEEKTFVERAVKNGFEREKANEIFKLMAQFADYGFNRSHSIAYAYLAFQTAYLKAHHPAHFFASVLSHEADDSAKVYKYSTELRSMGLKLLPPDINESGHGFTPVGDSVRFGLSAIKGIGTSTINSIVEARTDGRYTSLFDLVSRVESGAINKRGLESLIASGAFDSLIPYAMEVNEWRARNFESIDDAVGYGQRRWSDKRSGQNDLFGSLNPDKNTDFPLRDTTPWTRTEMTRNEKAALGFYLSSHPLEEFQRLLSDLNVRPVADYGAISSGDNLTVAGIVSSSQIRYSKKGNRFCTFRLEDQSAGLKCLLWAEPFERCGGLVREESLLIAEGRIEVAEGNDLTLIVKDLRLLAEAESENAKNLLIGLPSRAITEDVLFDLLSALRESRGNCRVELEVPIPGLSVGVELHGVRVKGSGRMEAALKEMGCTVKWHL